jgi:hypothetical protein
MDHKSDGLRGSRLQAQFGAVHGNAKTDQVGQMRQLGADQILDLDPIPFVPDEQVLTGRKRLDELGKALDEIFAPVNLDHASAWSDGRPSASINSNTLPGPPRGHCAGDTSLPRNASSCSDHAMMQCAPSEIAAFQPAGSSCAATSRSRSCGLGDRARA